MRNAWNKGLFGTFISKESSSERAIKTPANLSDFYVLVDKSIENRLD